MKKPVHKHRKHSAKFYNRLLVGGLILTVVLIAALVIANALSPDDGYIVTADGHVHTADGTHVGEAADMFGEDYVVSADGHVHTADGTHVATYDAAPTADSAEEAPAVEAESAEETAN